MRRVLILVLGLALALGGVVFFGARSDGFLANFGGEDVYVLVASRALEPDQSFSANDITIRPLGKEEALPPAAFVVLDPVLAGPDGGSRPLSEVEKWLVSRLASQPIKENTVLTADMVQTIEVRELKSAVNVVRLMTPLRRGERVGPENVMMTYMRRSDLQPGMVSVGYDEGVDGLLRRLGDAVAARDLAQDVHLSWFDVTTPALLAETDRAARQAAAAQAETAVVDQEPAIDESTLPLPKDEEEILAMDRGMFKARFKSTPGTFSLGEKEIGAAFVGKEHPVDVYVSNLQQQMLTEGVETHRLTLSGVRVRIYDDALAMPIYWIEIDPVQAKRLERMRRQGAIVTVVPAGQSMPAANGATVLCEKGVCYRSLATDSALTPELDAVPLEDGDLLGDPPGVGTGAPLPGEQTPEELGPPPVPGMPPAPPAR